MSNALDRLKRMILLTTGLIVSTVAITIDPQAATARSSSIEVALTPAETSAGASETAYILGAGDRVRVDVFQLPQYSGEHQVLIDGSLNLPRIGSVPVGGMTLEQAAKAIAAKYASARVLRDPQVTVNLLTPRPVRIGIAGEVNRPGSYTMSREAREGGTGGQLPTIAQALQLAGGITQAADLRNVRVSRLQGRGSQQTITVDLWQVIQTGNLGNDLTLRDGDTIFIPTASQINLAEAPQLAAASFSVDRNRPINIAVLGEVRQPGTHTIQGQGQPGQQGAGLPTVTQALKAAGGINPLADIRKVQIRRRTHAGSEQIVEVDLMQLLQAADFRQDLLLQDGDIVYVPTSEEINLAQASQLRSASFAPDKTQPLNITVIGEVFRPGPYTVTGSARTGQAGVPGGTGGGESVAPTVTRAIQVAGGIKPLANVRQVEVRRLTSTGEQRTITVDLWKLLQQGDSSQDAVLQEGDTIVVPLATAQDPGEAAQVAAASFSPDTIKVNVVGEVQKPGIVEVPPNSPLNQAIFAAGGFTNRAENDTVELIRLNPNGTVSRQEISIDFAQKLNNENNPVLYNNDVIVVGRSSLAGISDTLDAVLNPVGRFFSIFTLPFTLFNLFD
ncbi:periplasmic protein involved in polysaccharide export [Pleurocapsa sp. PCC 7327]|uniref:polysaccharide biosynthesis/export family protein n=1 Tax=Pleurocapsa sp. PCC 7327 TaxID=118163 RepID=UPI00029F8240|nr:SLBB domain-containing protein [Pleurocapsa sp. PCC 7327]AFY76786.1 periplasmic protein involved in polysaccharide export [Pleurocapsa sp. PCC 7327]